MGEEKQILIVSGVYPPEPYVSAQMSETIALELSKTNKVTVLCPPVSRPIGKVQIRKIESTDNYSVVMLPSYTCPESKILGRFRESYSFGKAVAKYIYSNRNRIKVIYANTHPTFGQYLLLNEAQKYGIPVILHVQDIYPESLTRKLGLIGRVLEPFFVWYDRSRMKKSAKIITISPLMKKALIESRNYQSDFVEIVYNWQNDDIFDNVNGDRSEKFTFMFAGSLNPTASLETVIEAFGKANLENSQLILAGAGSDKQHCVEVAGKFKNINIIFENITPDSVPFIQSKADVLLLPLKKGISMTALPSKLPAYMFSSKPIIACAETESDVAAILTQAECGWVVEPENSEMLKQQMIKCHAMTPNDLTHFGQMGRKYAISNFSKKQNLDKICRIIRSI